MKLTQLMLIVVLAAFSVPAFAETPPAAPCNSVVDAKNKDKKEDVKTDKKEVGADSANAEKKVP